MRISTPTDANFIPAAQLHHAAQAMATVAPRLTEPLLLTSSIRNPSTSPFTRDKSPMARALLGGSEADLDARI
jgi:hypothetical protein